MNDKSDVYLVLWHECASFVLYAVLAYPMQMIVAFVYIYFLLSGLLPGTSR